MGICGNANKRGQDGVSHRGAEKPKGAG